MPALPGKRHYWATAHAPGLVVLGRSIDAENKRAAETQAERIILPMLGAHVRRDIEIEVQEVFA